MKCKVHEDRGAIGKCTRCGTGVCKEFFVYVQGVMCKACVESIQRSAKPGSILRGQQRIARQRITPLTCGK